MKYLLNSREMKACDTGTIEYFGVLSAVLMERAALSVVEELENIKQEFKTCLIVCGSGNNGGDGFAIARLLYLKGYDVSVLFFGSEQKATEETRRQIDIAKKYKIPVVTEMPEDSYDLVVDSLFGIGLSRNLEGRYYDLIQHLNRMPGYKAAVDIASGINADNGQVMGTAFRADLTVTFGFAKIGQILYPGAQYTGKLAVKDIGIDAYGFLGNFPAVKTMEKKDLCLVPERAEDGNKGTFGKILIMAGSADMAGAGVLSARAAYAAGGGLVRIFTPEENRTVMQTLIPEAVLITYNTREDETEKIINCLDWADVIVLGPGIGTGAFSKKMTETVLKHTEKTCIVDADALNLIAENKDILSTSRADLIVTPHLGEMARLTGIPVSEIKENLLNTARNFSETYHVITVMKDVRTITVLKDGSVFINQSGNSGMATAGSGDVLTGVIAGLAAQGCPAGTAAPLGVYIHGLAGDRKALQKGEYGLLASDLPEGISQVLKEGITENETV